MTAKRGPEAPGFDVKRDVLFVGLGTSAVAYYRCFLPAMALGCDWVGIGGRPPKSAWVTGLVQGQSKMPNMLEDYKVVVLQQPAGDGWNRIIEEMREAGVKVIFEIDDYLHGIKHVDKHDFKEQFDNKYLWEIEQAMKRCDALIASTEWIRGNYLSFNKNAYLCKNGIDLKRYELTKPERSTVNIGWAGGTGHTDAIIPWLQQVANVMQMRENTTFISIGQPFAKAFEPHFENRSLCVPFAAIEQYPSAMMMLDIGLAPGGKGGWWRGKSDLRWLEASLCGIPIICNPEIYPDVVDEETGFTAQSVPEMTEKLMRLVSDEKLRTTVGENAREVVRETRSIEVMSQQWLDVFDKILGN